MKLCDGPDGLCLIDVNAIGRDADTRQGAVGRPDEARHVAAHGGHKEAHDHHEDREKWLHWAVLEIQATLEEIITTLYNDTNR